MIPNNAMLHQTTTDLMNKYHGQVDNALYAAYIACKTTGFYCEKVDVVCPWRMPTFNGPLCNLVRLREILGEHVEQHDLVPDEPARECPR